MGSSYGAISEEKQLSARVVGLRDIKNQLLYDINIPFLLLIRIHCNIIIILHSYTYNIRFYCIFTKKIIVIMRHL